MTYSTDIAIDEVYNDEIEFIRFNIEQNIFLFQDTIEKIYSVLSDDYLKVKREFEESLKTDDSEEKLRLYKYYSDILDEKASLIPQFIYKSLFLSIYGYYESLLYNDFVEKVLECPKSKNLTRDSFKLILTEKGLTDDNLDLFDFYGQLRNKLIHRNGHISNDDLRQKVDSFSTLQMIEGKVMIRNVMFLRDFLTFINSFTENLLKEAEIVLFGREK